MSARASDVTWTNGNGGWDTAIFWSPNTPPGAADRAIFDGHGTVNGYAVGLNISNVTVGDVVFSETSTNMFWKNTTNTLTVINSFVITQSVAATAINTLRTGTIAATNASGTATFKVGDYSTGTKGLLTMEHQLAAGDTTITNYPVLIADSFMVTSNSTFTFRAGTLTTSGGIIDRGTNAFFDVGSVTADVATWNMPGGTNSINYTGAGSVRLGLIAGSIAGVTVSGSNTLFSAGGSLNVGYSGTTTLTVSNGAHLTSGIMRIGQNALAASNSAVYVDGAGSRIDILGGLTVGNVSSTNQMIISNGGQVVVTNGFVTVGGGSASVTGNLLRVTGTGSVFQAFDLVQLGNASAFTDTLNRVEILDGAVVRSGSAAGATRLGSSAADADNSAWVAGAGSQWEITGPNALHVGESGPRSTLTIANGGHVTVTTTNIAAIVQIGTSASSSNNTAVVTGSGSLWDTGTNGFYIGNVGFGNVLIISNGAHVTSKAAPTIPVAIGNAASASNNVGTVTGAGSRWDIDGPGGAVITFRVGGGSRTNELNILNGGQVVVTNGIMSVGAAVGANGNVVRVSGSAALLETGDLLQIGAATGSLSNSLEITAGGVVRTGSGTAASRIGRSAGDNSNRALIDGIGSLWEITGVNGLAVANDGTGNTLTVQNGGTVRVTEGPMLVGAPTGVGNAATITGGSVLVTNATGTGVLSVRAGTLTFNGGTVVADFLRLTNASSSVFTFNSGTLAISGSMVSNGSAFVAGDGVGVATLNLLGGTNSFMDGLNVSSNTSLRGIGTIVGNVTLANGAVWSPGSSAGTQTVIGAATLNPGTVLNYDLDAPGNPADLINVTGNLTLDGTLNVANLGGLANGQYVLFNYGSVIDNGLNVGTMPGSFSGTVSNDAGGQRILLVVTGGAPADPFTAWQLQYFNSTNCAACGGNADFDGDGISNTNEFVSGTDPTNSLSGLRIVATTRAGNDVNVTWATVGGKTNIVQASAGTANGSYSNDFADLPASLTIVSGIGNVTTNYVDGGGATNTPARYYRVRLVP